MSFDHFAQWRQTLTEVRQSQHCAIELRHFLRGKINRLHRAIHLPAHERLEALEAFVMNYVEQVPTQLKTLARALLQIEALANSEYFLQIACDFFTHQPELIEQEGGWPALLAEAYLAHRVVEEIYDRAALHGYFPAITKATMQANVIVHGVLGEEFANQLDMAVFYAVENLYPVSRVPGLSLVVNKTSAPFH
ncbi:MAG: hypothetical protein RL497_736 [Pseudomonadota bacterium]|jgi:hypothetical protein